VNIMLILDFSPVTIVLLVLSLTCSWLCGHAAGGREHGRAAMWAAGVAAALALIAAIDAIEAHWAGVPLYAAGAVGWAWFAWQNWRRRRKKRALRELGYKARARLAALARNMPRPGPVLRPAPQGARA
jgi:hypothetical protein